MLEEEDEPTLEVLWKQEEVRDTVWKRYYPPEGSTVVTMYFDNHNEDEACVTVYAETPIGRIPVHDSNLDDRYGVLRCGHRTFPIVAEHLTLEVRPAHSEGTPVLSLAMNAA